ncbi:cell division control protein 23 [Pluteus cervinus]|uniref:Cell division control protein 23 n=1 Tax=Pluteus cervinus TaxID=181527 RepID=A0ACD3BC02_9AGAR|nr:cell division control protein 23 [Pluteus cervinus]
MDTVNSQLIAELRQSVQECSERGLFVASKWSSDLLLSVPATKRKLSSSSPPQSAFSTSTPARSQSPHSNHPFGDNSPSPAQPLAPIPITPARHPQAPPLSAFDTLPRTNPSADEQDILVAARGCMENREFHRAAYLLRECESPKARFMALYSQFLVSEKKSLRDWHKLDSNRYQPSVPVNESLQDLLQSVQSATDPWLLFLKAIFFSRLSRREEAIEAALLSLAGFPWNWSAWLLLGSCIGDGDELSSLLPLLPLRPSHPLVQLFQVKTLNELHNPSEHELGLCDQLLQQDWFPNSLWIMSLRACVLYHLHGLCLRICRCSVSHSLDFGQAETQFEQILALDPYRIDDIDVYSNILYVTESQVKLSRLAHEFLALDKDRPEVCCLVGNYYSLRSEHEKAVKYFRRATQLDRTYLSAWTLMGHEYVEMKNSHAAIEAYRRAVDVNRKDYRAWYGLGQAYELLNMHNYALHYYQHATALRPYDVRLWQAQGICYEEIGRIREAIVCLKRALVAADPHEITIRHKLAKLHRTLDEVADAVSYHKKIVEICQADQRPVREYAKSCLEVAEYQMNLPSGDLLLARDYLERVAASNAEDVNKASELLKQLKTRDGSGIEAHENNDTGFAEE